MKVQNLSELKKISVIIPNYNHSNYIIERINSFLNQSYKPHEIIVIDDKSTDNSLDILQDFEKKKLIKLLINKKNVGGTESVNTGLKIATGEYLYPASMDDINCKDFFKKTALKLDENPQTNICMTYPSFYHDKENAYVTQPWIFPFTKEGYYKPSQIIKLQKKKTFHTWSHCCLFRSDHFKDELYRADFKWFCDWYLTNRDTFLNGMYYLPEVLAHYRVSNTQYSASADSNEQTKVIYYMMTEIQKDKNKEVLDGFINSFIFLYYFDLIIPLKNNANVKIFFLNKMFIFKLYFLKYKKNILKYFPMKLKFIIKSYIYKNIINKFR